jgi:hypothetical protein
MQGLGVYWCIIEMLYEENGYLLLEEYERISFELQVDFDVVKSVIEKYGLFQKDSEKFWSSSVLNRLDARKSKSEKARDSIKNRWDRYKIDTNVLQTNNETDTNVLRNEYECNTIKERKVKESKEKEINILFEYFWNLYDKKVGDKQKLEVKWNGLNDDERQKAMQHIPKYKISQPDKKFRKDPSTYLNNKSFNDEIINNGFLKVEPLEISNTKKEELKEYWQINYGHLAKTKEEFMKLVAEGKIED